MRRKKFEVFFSVVWLLIPSVIAQTPSSDQELIFPISADLFRSDVVMRTLYSITNLGPEVIVRFRFFNDTGADFLSSSSLPIPPNGIFEEPRPLLIVVIEHIGWTRILVPSGAKIEGRETLQTFMRASGGGFQLVNSTQLNAVKPARRFHSTIANVSRFRSSVFGLAPVTEPDLRQTAFAIVNPSPNQTATVNLTTLDPKGTLACSTSLTISPQNRLARFGTEIFAPCQVPALGSIEITSDLPIALGAVDVFFPEGRFSSVRVTAVETP
jgi:hypothetical protein